MPRTQEQIDADDALTAAIEQCWFAYYPDTEPGVLMEYVISARRRSYDETDGEPLTANALMPRDGNVPLDTLLGLLDYGATRIRKRIAED
jgi:hypothetical protein